MRLFMLLLCISGLTEAAASSQPSRSRRRSSKRISKLGKRATQMSHIERTNAKPFSCMPEEYSKHFPELPGTSKSQQIKKSWLHHKPMGLSKTEQKLLHQNHLHLINDLGSQTAFAKDTPNKEMYMYIVQSARLLGADNVPFFLHTCQPDNLLECRRFLFEGKTALCLSILQNPTTIEKFVLKRLLLKYLNRTQPVLTFKENMLQDSGYETHVEQLSNSLVATFFGILDMHPDIRMPKYFAMVSQEIKITGKDFWETVPHEREYNRKLIQSIFQYHRNLVGKGAVEPTEDEEIRSTARTLISALCAKYLREKHFKESYCEPEECRGPNDVVAAGSSL